MIKSKLAALAAIAVLFFLTACSRSGETNTSQRSGGQDRIMEIRDRMFIAQVNEVYLNASEYLGRAVRLEGVFTREHFGDRDYHFVIRYGPGCCGDDGKVGFEVRWTGNQMQSYPEHDSWVDVLGVLRSYSDNNSTFLYLDLSSLTVLDRRGREFVNQ